MFGVFDIDVFDEVVVVSNDNVFVMVWEVVKIEGILVGIFFGVVFMVVIVVG